VIFYFSTTHWSPLLSGDSWCPLSLSATALSVKECVSMHRDRWTRHKDSTGGSGT